MKGYKTTNKSKSLKMQIDVEYSDVYASRFSSNEVELPSRKHVSRLILAAERQNFICRVKNFNGEILSISHTPNDSLADLYSKVNVAIGNGIAFNILREYGLENGSDYLEPRVVHDLFVLSEKGEIKSIPRNANINLRQFISSNPEYFKKEPEFPIIDNYAVYLVDNVALDHMTAIKSETYWDFIKAKFIKSLSCKLRRT